MKTETAPPNTDDIDPFYTADIGSDIVKAMNEMNQGDESTATKVEVEVSLETGDKGSTKEKPDDDQSTDDSTDDNSLSALLGDEPAEEKPLEDDLDDRFPDEPSDLRNDAKGQARWGELKQEARSARNALRDLERENKELKSQIESASQGGASDEWKAKYEELSKRDAILALESDDTFRNNILTPFQQANSELTRIVESYNIPKDKIAAALKAESRVDRNKALTEIANEVDMNEFDKQDLSAIILDYLNFGRKVEEGYSKAEELNEARRKQMEQSAEEQRESKFQEYNGKRKEVDGLLSKDSVLGEFVGKIDAPKLDSFLKGEVDPKLHVYHGYAGLLLPMLRKEIGSLRAALKEKVQSSPSVRGGGAAAPEKKTDDFSKPGGNEVFEAMQKWRGK